MDSKETFSPDCIHECTSNCRREGCNCECGEWHGKYEDPMEKVIKQMGFINQAIYGINPFKV